MTNRDEVHPAMPPALVAAVLQDFQPVRPLLSPARRSLVAGATAAAAGLALIGAFGVRETVAPMVAASLFVRVALGAGLIVIALREGVPSEGVSGRTRKLAAVLGVAGLIVLPLLLQSGASSFDAADSLCYWLVLLAAAPGGAVLTLLLRRAYLLRPVSALAIACLGAGYLADFAASLVCASVNLAHAHLFHGGAVLTLMIAGTTIGWVLRRPISGTFPTLL